MQLSTLFAVAVLALVVKAVPSLDTSADDTNPLGRPFANALLPVTPISLQLFSLFRRQGCPNLTLRCPSGVCCSYDTPCCGNTCCASGYLCTGGTAAAPCCVAISSPSNACGGSNPCSRPGDLPCQGINICCPPNNSCYYDNSGTARCSSLGAPNPVSSSATSTTTRPVPRTTTTSYSYPSSPSSSSYSYSRTTSYSYSSSRSTTSSISTTSCIVPCADDSSSNTNNSSSSSNRGLSSGVIAGIAVGSTIAVIIIVLIAWYLYRRCKKRKQSLIPRRPSYNSSNGGPKVSNESKSTPADVDIDYAAKDALVLNSVPIDFVGPADIERARIMYGTLQDGDIRVLEILKGKDQDRIFCQLWLHTIEPQQNLKVNRRWSGYEALSYVWSQKPRDPEDEGKRAVITVVNPAKPDMAVDFVVGWNLHQSLKFFRQTGDSRIIWTDLICINQDKDAKNLEKMAQVMKMTEIYAHATQVQVWLGPSFPASRRAAGYFTPFEGMLLRDDDLLHSYRSARQPWDDLFEGFQDRPWWTRAWTIQEVMTCPNPMLNCGRDCLSLNLVLRLIKFAHNNELEVVTRDSARDYKYRFSTLELGAMRERMGSVEVPHLPEWFATFHKQSATNPRDRIFAYLGLAREALPFEPRTTYKDSIERVWAEGTKLALSQYNDLDFICLGRGREWGVPGIDYEPLNPEERGTKEELTVDDLWALPSWVPNFRATGGDGYSSARLLPLSYYPRARSVFNASGGVRSMIAVNDGLTELQVIGLRVDKIKYISKPNLGAIDGTKGDIFSIEVAQIMASFASQCWASCHPDTCTHYPGPRGGSYGTALLKTVVMDLDFEGNRLSPEENIHTMNNHLDQPPNTFQLGETDNHLRVALWNKRMQNAKSRWTNWRRFFVSERGYIGIANWGCQVGDDIYIIGGATVPFIMRDTSSTTKTGRRKLTFVGESYLHGFMDGELAEALWASSEDLVIV